MAKQRPSLRDRRAQDKQHSQEPGQGFKTYTSTLKEDKHQTNSQVDEPTTKITLRVPVSIAGLIDEVYGKKKLRQEVDTKQEFVADILRPYLESERKRLLELEIQELEDKKQQLVSLSG